MICHKSVKKTFCIVTFTDISILSTLSGAANVSKPSSQRCCSNQNFCPTRQKPLAKGRGVSDELVIYPVGQKAQMDSSL